jgi:DNA processing protein
MSVHGGVLAEAPMGAPPERGAFPARNRLISGLADAVIVVEGDVRSGALITARLAEAQGRTVFAVPGSVHAWGSRGPHRLLATGARVVTDPDDVLAALGLPATSGPRGAADWTAAIALAPAERRLLAALDDGQARSVDGLAASAGLDVAAAAAALVALEVRGLVRRMPGGLYAADPAPRTP